MYNHQIDPPESTKKSFDRNTIRDNAETNLPYSSTTHHPMGLKLSNQTKHRRTKVLIPLNTKTQSFLVCENNSSRYHTSSFSSIFSNVLMHMPSIYAVNDSNVQKNILNAQHVLKRSSASCLQNRDLSTLYIIRNVNQMPFILIYIHRKIFCSIPLVRSNDNLVIMRT